MSGRVLTWHCNLVVRNLYWACFIEKLRSRRVHLVLNNTSVEFILLSTRAVEILSVLGPDS